MRKYADTTFRGVHVDVLIEKAVKEEQRRRPRPGWTWWSLIKFTLKPRNKT